MNDNKHVVATFVEELWNERNLEVADSIFDEDCHTHQLQSGSSVVAVPRGPAAIKAHATDWLSAFLDLKFTVEQMFTDGDRVISQLPMDGTQTGQWMGIPPTGKTVAVPFCAIFTFTDDDRLKSEIVYNDRLSLLSQLGIVNLPG